jgi:glutamate-5-semialdehyde dehydrogenase
LAEAAISAANPIRELAERAKRASRRLASLDRGPKDAALLAIAARLRAEVAAIGEANARDVEAARAAGLDAPMIDRLGMGPKVVESTAAGVEFIASLADPVGSRSEMRRLKNGLLAGRERLPLGVIAMIYEARPNVTADAAALCLKAGNAVLLRGGKEAAHTNARLGELIREALTSTGLPADAVQIVPPGGRDEIRELLSLSELIDLAIPRGGPGLIRFVAENARVPVVKHYQGVCHLFLDRGADAEMALALALNGKQRPSVCNALECLLVDQADAERLLPDLGRALLANGIELRGCPRTLELVPGTRAAADDDYGREFLAKILAVRVVRDLDAALDHVARYGSNHTEAICTPSYASAQRWLREVDASCVLVNASTRFNDGGELGLGAEIGISTSKLHAYGPMGLESLTTEKWVVLGEGQIRA